MRLPPAAPLLLLLALPGQAQVIHVFHGDNFGDDLGEAVAGAGDVDGDGFDDLIVGVPSTHVNGSNSGSAYVYSGCDGTQLYVLHGDAPGDRFGHAVSGVGDADGDGFDDFIVGAWVADANGSASGLARLFSGVDGSVIRTFVGSGSSAIFGWSVSGAGDVDGDGFADVIVGAPGDASAGANAGRAQVFSGSTGALLHTFDGDSDQDFMGQDVGGGGDVNGDGFDDVIVGAPDDDGNGANSGTAYVFSGLDGSTLYTIQGGKAGDMLGQSVGMAGDVDGDGFADFIVGAPWDDTAGNQAGMARVYSGVDGSTLHTVFGDSDVDLLGWSVNGAGDFDADGFDDFIVGAYFDDKYAPFTGSAYVYSGSDGGLLLTKVGGSADDFMAFSVAAAGDVDGDGRDDVIVGAPGDDDETGSAWVLGSFTSLPSPYCFADGVVACPCANDDPNGGCANSTGSGGVLGHSGSTSASSDDLILNVSGMPASQIGLAFIGNETLVVPLGDGQRCVGGQVLRFPPRPADAAGGWSDGPGLAALGGIPAGFTIHFQVWYRDPGGPCGTNFNFTNALAVTYGL